MKVLVMGYGSIGRRHAANALSFGHRVAVHDPQPSELPPPEMRYFPMDVAAYAWNPDAIVIATPASTHGTLYKRAIAVCHSVFIEKPLALNMFDFCNGHSDGRFGVDSRSHVQVGCNWRFHPLVTTLRHHADIVPGWPQEADLWVLCDSREWPGTGYADGLLECGAHEIDLAQYFCGKITHVSDASFVENIWRLALEHETGAKSRITICDRAQLGRGMRITWPTHVGGYHVPYGDPHLLDDDEISYRLEME